MGVRRLHVKGRCLTHGDVGVFKGRQIQVFGHTYKR